MKPMVGKKKNHNSWKTCAEKRGFRLERELCKNHMPLFDPECFKEHLKKKQNSRTFPSNRMPLRSVNK